jgi:hypothetical protein
MSNGNTIVVPNLLDAVTAAQTALTTAQTAATAAAASATAAANAATSQLANHFYGLLSSPPPTRPDGSPCQDGDFYYNTTNKSLQLRVGGQFTPVAMSASLGALLAANNLADVSNIVASRANLGLGNAALYSAGVPNGLATLDVGGHVPSSQLNLSTAGSLQVSNNLSELTATAATARGNLGLGSAAVLAAGSASGAATLDGGGHVPVIQLPVGTASGIAALDGGGHVPFTQLNAGVANGIATLNASGLVTASQLPAATSPTSMPRSTGYTTVAGDLGHVITATTGSSADVSIQLLSAASAGDGGVQYVAKVDTGNKKVIVLDSNGTTNLAWLSNQWDVVGFRSDGSVWNQWFANLSARLDTFNATGTWTKPPGTAMVRVDLQAAGGGGGGGTMGSSVAGGGGGGGGARYDRLFNASELGATETVTVGVAGTAGGGTSASPGGAGGAGGATSFGTTVRFQVGGGGGGPGGSNSTVTGASGGSCFGVPNAVAGGPAVAFEGASSAALGTNTTGNCTVFGGASAATSAIGAAITVNTGSSMFGGAAGGPGGGATTAAGFAGVAGGGAGSYVVGGGSPGGGVSGNGTAGSGARVGGGGGGGSPQSTAGAIGGTGGIGGGGGGGGSSGGLSGGGGAGGAGGAGQAIITTYFTS